MSYPLSGLIVKLSVKGGDGGKGAISIENKTGRRISFTGGNGGRGGSVYLSAYSGVGSLRNVKSYKLYKAENGEHGQGRCRHGKAGKSLELRVPLYTDVYFSEELELENCLNHERSSHTELVNNGNSLLLAAGGNGGIGNSIKKVKELPEIVLKGKEGGSKQCLLVYSPPIDILILVNAEAIDGYQRKEDISFFSFRHRKTEYYKCAIASLPIDEKKLLIFKRTKRIFFLGEGPTAYDLDRISELTSNSNALVVDLHHLEIEIGRYLSDNHYRDENTMNFLDVTNERRDN
jgi:hypothetical protein